MLRNVEILAPAGGAEALLAGVENGADAVYLGGHLFNARQYASNFSNEDLKKAVAYCHTKGVKVYVTVNTLVFNNELEEVMDYLYFLYSIGVDAVIVQDLGLLLIIKEILPGLPVHASTQMTIHNEFGANYLHTRGVERVVLARELSISDIREIHKKSDIELEIFVHGALCISYSGQCLFSSMVGGRSGNRGKCAQPCRLPYKLVETKNGKIVKEFPAPGDYLLSTRDLNTIKILPEMVEAGAVSFKFEGRMKRPEYVATVIRVYRQALDRYLSDPSNYSVTQEELTALEQIFNRDFTHAYLIDKPGADLMGYTKPNNRGIFLGRVVDVEKGQALVKLEEDLSIGDGIQVWVSIGGRKGETINNIKINGQNVQKASRGSIVSLNLPRGIRKGDRIFKTYDYKLMEKAESTYAHEQPKTKLNFIVKGQIGEPLEVYAQDELGNSVQVKSQIKCQKAVKHSLDEEVLVKQLGRLGDTDYELGSLKLELNGQMMLPLSELNKVRRLIVEKLEGHKQKNVVALTCQDFVVKKKAFLRTIQEAQRKSMKNRSNLNIKVGDYKSFNTALSYKVNNVFIPLLPFKNKEFTIKQVIKSIEQGKSQGVKVIPYLPRIAHPHMINDIIVSLQAISQIKPEGILVGNLGLIQLVQETAPETAIYGDYSLNILNWASAKFLLRDKLVSLCLSPELNFTQLKSFPREIMEVSECLVHGYLPLIVSRYCPIFAINGGCKGSKHKESACKNIQLGLKDRKGYVFPLEMDSNCLMYLYNTNVLSVIDSLYRMKDLGIGAIRLEMEREGHNIVSRVLELYEDALTNSRADMVEAIKKLYPGGVTKGHYYRGVE
ncbi:MAG: U32 family peptidase [Clostridia bacterium]|nr:U32 family peptidase [Clostridia bacterium]